MGNLLHANAKTTIRIRKEIQNSKESLAKLAKKYSLNVKTIARWRNSESVSDKRSGPLKPKSVLSDTEQQIICEFRRVTKFSLDDCYISLRDKIKSLSRSNLYRCLKRNNLHIIPQEDLVPRVKKKFKEYSIGYFHVDITEIKLAGSSKFYLFVAIDRASKYAYYELYERMTMQNSCIFLHNLIQDSPFKITKILTDNGAQFTYALLALHLRPKNIHPFDAICQKNNIDHRLTQFRHPWTNGQVEVLNRVIKQHTTKKYHYDTVDELKRHLMAFLLVYNYQRPLKSLKYKTPYEKLLEIYQSDPKPFLVDPNHKIVGLNIWQQS